MGTTQVTKHVVKINRRGEVVKDRCTFKETTTLKKVAKFGLLAGATILLIGMLSSKK